MTDRLQGKVALITGGGTGIGAAMARRFSDSGASVVVSGRRAEPIQEVARDIDGLAVQADVRDRASLAEAVRLTVETFAGLDIVVANAGIIDDEEAEYISDDQWSTMIDINLTGVMRTAREALPFLKKRNGGAIVITASVAGLFGIPGSAGYCSAKTAVLGLTRSMAYDYGPFGIRVNALCPGWVRTPMSEMEMAALAESKGIEVEAAVRAVTRFLPLRRMAAPEEIAACAEFLASDDASFVTGAVLTADGGGSVVDAGTLAFAFD